MMRLQNNQDNHAGKSTQAFPVPPSMTAAPGEREGTSNEHSIPQPHTSVQRQRPFAQHHQLQDRSPEQPHLGKRLRAPSCTCCASGVMSQASNVNVSVRPEQAPPTSSRLLLTLIQRCNEGVQQMRHANYSNAIRSFSLTLRSARGAIRAIESNGMDARTPDAAETSQPSKKRARTSCTLSINALQSQKKSPGAGEGFDGDSNGSGCGLLNFEPISSGSPLSSVHGFLYQDARLVSMYPAGQPPVSATPTAGAQASTRFASSAFQSLCAVTIYNTALAHHLQAQSLMSRNHKAQARIFLSRALRLYEQAYRLFSVSPEAEMQHDLSRALGILSNVGILYAELDQCELADKCWLRLLDFILRLSAQHSASCQQQEHSRRNQLQHQQQLLLPQAPLSTDGLKVVLGQDLDKFFTNISHLFSLQSNAAGAA